jgi:predicted nucleotidyltransferase
MDKEAALKALELFRLALEARGVRVLKMVLFGSLAKGTAHDNSDIDVVVVSEDFRRKSGWETIKLLGSAIAEVFEPIEAFPRTPEQWEKEDDYGIVAIAKQGEIVYSREEAAARPKALAASRSRRRPSRELATSCLKTHKQRR